LFVLGLSVAAIRKLISAVTWLLDRTFISRAEIDSRDEAYAWLDSFLREHKGQDALQFTVTTKAQPGSNAQSSEESRSGLSPLRFNPAPGLHFIFHKGWPVLVRRQLAGEAGQSNLLKPSERLESLSLQTLAVTPQCLHDLVQSCRAQYISQDRSRTVVFTGTQYGGWQRLHSRPLRSLDTVILPPKVLHPLLTDIRDYLSPETERWYAQRGIPYRRGLLFHGPSGTGKTSLVIALAGEFNLGVYVVSLAGKGMNDDRLLELLGSMPRRCILLLEDIDVAFPDRAKASASSDTVAERAAGITSSGLLNALDGVAAQEGRLVVMSTNYRERLDSALVRPGRIDHEVAFQLASREDVQALFLNFFEHAEEKGAALDVQDAAARFASKVPVGKLSIAALQGFLMDNKRDPEGAIQQIE
ncbi:P-loop containing nucleoside triphosphate hydrolase protein, partial [Protomyces lactucae-debilis]